VDVFAVAVGTMNEEWSEKVETIDVGLAGAGEQRPRDAQGVGASLMRGVPR
jgi:hypothetical protein